MTTRFFIILALAILVSCNSNSEKKAADASSSQAVIPAFDLESVVYQARDKEILEQILDMHKGASAENVSALMVRVGLSFLETVYVGNTLEVEEEEQLLINLRELDCTTFAENCLAITRTLKSGALSFEQYASELMTIRYRNEKLDGYPSRLHYFCDWIHNNQQKGLIDNRPENLMQVSFQKEINFMSTHPESYWQLKGDSTLIETIADQEKLISSREMFFIPEDNVAAAENQLREGDIVGITTNIGGLAIQHVGILVRKGGRIHLMHASSNAWKVVVSANTLESYLKNSKSATGIMIARPL